MKKFKRIFALILAAAMLFACSACGDKTNDENEPTTNYEREVKTKIAVPEDVTGMSAAKLADDRSYAYEVKNYSDTTEIAALIKNGEADIAILPVTDAAKLYNETSGGIQILAVSNMAYLYGLCSGGEITKYSQLKGKTVYATGKGTANEQLLKYLLLKNDIDPEKDVTIDYSMSADELTASAIDGKIEICILPEPYAIKAQNGNEKLLRFFDFAKTWDSINKTSPVQSVAVARTDYVKANPDIISEFMGFFEISLNYIYANLDMSSVMLFKKGFFETAEQAKSALGFCNILFLEGEEMKTAVKTVFAEFGKTLPEAIGGQIPDDGIFYIG